MPSTSIVIPIHNNWWGCHQLLFDLYKNCSLIEEVILVDDASPDEAVQSGIAWWKSSDMLPIEVITNETNQGFLKSSNLGIQYAVEDIICLISTDVRVRNDLVQTMKDIISVYDSSALMGGKLYTESTGWNEYEGKIFPYLEGWLLATTRDGWEELGRFDERYVPNDFEDVDLSTTAKDLGWDLVELQCGLEHAGAQSLGYNSNREEITKINKEKFRKKWIDE